MGAKVNKSYEVQFYNNPATDKITSGNSETGSIYDKYKKIAGQQPESEDEQPVTGNNPANQPEEESPIDKESMINDVDETTGKFPRALYYINGLNENTRNFLKTDKNFMAFEVKIEGQMKLLYKLEKDIIKKQKLLVQAYNDFKNTPETDQEKYTKAFNKYQKAYQNYEYARGEYSEENKKLDEMMSNLTKYAYTIRDWKDGTKSEVNKTLTVNGVVVQHFEGTATKVTLANGQKAYELNGTYYALADNGDIDFNNPIQQ